MATKKSIPRKKTQRSTKQKVYDAISASNGNTTSLSRSIDVFIMSLIGLNIIALILETDPTLSAWQPYFITFELISVIIFSVEYILRLWTATCNPKYAHPFKGRIKYIFSFMGLVDLLAILPFYIPFIIKADLRFIRVLRLFRLFRILKFGRYTGAVAGIGRVIKDKKEELVITIFSVVILLIVSSSVMFHIENQAQPENFSSIGATLWWGVATLTTVGYGDVYPVTALGKFLASVLIILGIGLFALPTSILASGFTQAVEEDKARRNAESSGIKEDTSSSGFCCPHCGKTLELK